MSHRDMQLERALLRISLDVTEPGHWRRKEAERLLAASHNADELVKEIKVLCTEELKSTFCGNHDDRHQVLSQFESIVEHYMGLVSEMGLVKSSGRSVAFVGDE